MPSTSAGPNPKRSDAPAPSIEHRLSHLVQGSPEFLGTCLLQALDPTATRGGEAYPGHLGDVPQRVQLARLALALLEQAHGPESPRIVDALIVAAGASIEAERVAEGAGLYLRANNILKHGREGSPYGRADVLFFYALNLEDALGPRAAEEAYRAAIFAAQDEGWHEEPNGNYRELVLRLAGCLRQQGKLKDADETLEALPEELRPRPEQPPAPPQPVPPPEPEPPPAAAAVYLVARFESQTWVLAAEGTAADAACLRSAARLASVALLTRWPHPRIRIVDRSNGILLETGLACKRSKPASAEAQREVFGYCGAGTLDLGPDTNSN